MSWKRFIAVFDPHGDKQDRPTVDKVIDFCSTWKPHLRIHGGDNWDYRPLRSKASDDERRESMSKDYHQGSEFLHRLKPTHFLRGNHDERLWKLLEADHGVDSDYAAKIVGEIISDLDKMGCKMLPYHYRKGVLSIGKLKVIHGYYAGLHSARQHALVYGNCLFGHIHSISEATIARLKTETAHACGCLCQTDLGYHEAKPGTLMWEHGFIYGVTNTRTGDYHYWQARKCNGKWMLPSDIIQTG